ncbi:MULTISPECIES: mannose-1-phosphate guanylyltransferase/mannose-6-phosphate isomerase [unclassified Polynucleobacter]|uniref:mannose-1-phosphate guanylyltransferase/mannose-6-phosphate isomerase n=1 Tax=unclassified Polynucleobacter TaxID=2640945 RepID=UPI0025728042|nr:MULTISPECIES: mannose-1-phosphate guanylyltransferase/mannose-6-phosphate isomerase [unclassified Polynucleobacter]BEI42138.1 mannose-1-phosphate guanylyltransferase/mannose-6-phosphate isomerase [Polynucleobacter sp. HIN10]BEI43916.1 mannose-1-phosphate guanylyltransferase/mannose-6-phosphate isomerase [Polynucleobacter sp. HIN11]
MIRIVPNPNLSSKVIPVILCGGSGTRLWPLSRSGFPKQFLVLSSNEDQHSLFQQALSRAQKAIGSHAKPEPALIVTNEEHRFLVLDQLRELKDAKATLLLEPVARNTAPALTLAALCAQAQGDDPILLITPADQTIANQPAFEEAMHSALHIAQSGAIAILGVTPTGPETGYGYIKAKVNAQVNIQGAGDIGMTVERFVEKPDVATATQYLKEGSYYWNGGMFVLKASVWLAALQAFRPDILEASTQAWGGKTSDAHDGTVFIRPDKALFEAIPSESIDYAVIEQCPGSRFPIQMVPLDAGWNDLGAWDAVWQVGAADNAGNVTRGDTVLDQTTNSLVYSSTRLVSAVGVNDLVIVETADAVLVANRANSQEVKAIVSRLEKAGREEKNLHRKVNRPWGWYDSVDEGERFKVKRIQVKPGASLSLQMHHHRAEHWIVVKGIAEITNGDQVLTLHENQSTFIPQGQTHRLANPGTEPLEIIEVQSGSYLGEDDIVRFEDTYGRQ